MFTKEHRKAVLMNTSHEAKHRETAMTQTWIGTPSMTHTYDVHRTLTVPGLHYDYKHHLMFNCTEIPLTTYPY